MTTEYNKTHKFVGLGVKCSKRILAKHSNLRTGCSRWARIKRNGKPYCKQHDPVAEKERQAARRAKWDAEWAARRAEKLRNSLEQEYCEGLTNEELRAGIKNKRDRC